MRFDNLTKETAEWHAQQATLTTGLKHIAIPTPDKEERGLIPTADLWMVARADIQEEPLNPRYAEELRNATHVVWWEEIDESGEWTPMSMNASSRAQAEEYATGLHADGMTNIRIKTL